MINKTKTAHLLVKLEDLKDQLNNEILPLLSFTHLDEKMLQTAELLAQDIQEFINNNEFVIVNQGGK